MSLKKHSTSNNKLDLFKYIVWQLIKTYFDICIKHIVLNGEQNGAVLCCLLICIVFIDQLYDCVCYILEKYKQMGLFTLPDGFKTSV